MKPSPTLEEIRARHDDIERRIPMDGQYYGFKDAHADRAALLALISAQPGGEGVTRAFTREVFDWLNGFCERNGKVESIGPPNTIWVHSMIRCDMLAEHLAQYLEMHGPMLRPTSPDPARATEEREGK